MNQSRKVNREGIKIEYFFRDEMTACDIYKIIIPKHKILEWVNAPGVKVEFTIAVSAKHRVGVRRPLSGRRAWKKLKK